MRGFVLTRGRVRAVAGLSAILLAAVLLVSLGCGSARTPRPEKWAKPVNSITLINWHKLNDDVYRSEQPTRRGFQEIREVGIKTIVNLRDKHSDASLVEGLGLGLVEVPMNAGSFSEADIIKALRAVWAAPKPVLIHCQRGADRTGVVAAMYRVVCESWTKEDAIDELIHGGYGFNRVWYHNIPAFILKSDPVKIRALLAVPVASGR